MVRQKYNLNVRDFSTTKHLLCIAIAVTVCPIFGSDSQTPESVKSEQRTDRSETSRELWKKFRADEQSENMEKANATLRAILRANPKEDATRYLLAFNHAYDRSSQYDLVDERYLEIKEGIKVLMDGCKSDPQNREFPYLVASLLGSRIGLSDERQQFRALFADDSAFHDRLSSFVDIDQALGPAGKPDNWLVAGLWFDLSKSLPEPSTVQVQQKVVQGVKVRIDQLLLSSAWTRDEWEQWVIHPLLVEIGHANCLREYASAVEEDGHFGETAVGAWAAVERAYDRLASQGIREENKTLIPMDRIAYWQKRAQVEKSRPVVRGRSLLFQAREKERQSFLREAEQLYRKGFDQWAQAFEQNKNLVEDDDLRDYLTASIKHYIAVRQSLDLTRLPTPFSLGPIREKWLRLTDEPAELSPSGNPTPFFNLGDQPPARPQTEG